MIQETKSPLKKRRYRVKKLIASINVPARSSLFFTVANLLSKAAALLFTPIFTRLLTASEYGEFSLFSSYLSVAVLISGLEISGGIIMRCYQKSPMLKNLSTLSALMLILPLSIPTVLAIYLVTKNSEGLSFLYAYPLLLLTVISVSVMNLYTSYCRFCYRWKSVLIISLLQSILTPFLVINLFSVFEKDSIDGVTLKVGATSAVSVLICFVLLFNILKSAYSEIRASNMGLSEAIGFSKSCLKLLLRLSLPLLPYYFSVMLISQIDKLMISHFFGKESLAKYSVAYSAGIALTAVTNGILGALLPWIMRKARGGKFDKIKSALSVITTVGVAFILLFLCVAPEIFELLAPRNYHDALPVIFASAIIPLPLSITQCASSIAIAEERTIGPIICGAIPALLSFFLNKLLLPHSGIIVSAIITTFSFIVLMLLSTLNIKRITKKDIINVNNTFQKLLFLSFISAFIFTFREIIVLRIICSIFSLLVLISTSKSAVSLIKETV